MTLPNFDHPHGWTWRDGMSEPGSIHVEPAFLDHLGAVFIRIDRGDRHRGIWLSREVMEEFITALRAAADAPEYDGEDGWGDDADRGKPCCGISYGEYDCPCADNEPAGVDR